MDTETLQFNQFVELVNGINKKRWAMELEGGVIEIDTEDRAWRVSLYNADGDVLRTKEHRMRKQKEANTKALQQTLQTATDYYNLVKEKGIENIRFRGRRKETALEKDEKRYDTKPLEVNVKEEQPEPEEDAEGDDLVPELKPKPEKKYDIVEVKWIDSKGITDSWEFADDLQDIEPEVCHTTGYLFKENKDYIVIVQSYSDEMVLGRMCIPVLAIKHLERLGNDT